MWYVFTIVSLLLLSTSLAAEVNIKREELISGNWIGVILGDDSTGEKVCGVRARIRYSGGNTSRVFLTTHGEAISDNGSRVRYDFAVGPSHASSIIVDGNTPHPVNRYKLGNRKRLIDELKKGEKAKITWQDYLTVETSIVSLSGFSKAFDTAKEWCDGDGLPPVITLVGNSSENIELGTAYVDAGASAFDDIDGDISTNIASSGNVNTNAMGNYSITYKVSDAAGNAAAPVVRTVNVTADVTPPIISLLGTTPVNIELGTTYNDAGASGADNIDGDISAGIALNSNVNTNAIGSYSITYSVSDAAGNMATPVVRTVNVTADMTPPVITLAGYPSVGFELGTSYIDAGAMVMDNADGDISGSIVTTSTVDTNVVGSYSVTYNASDAAGNAATPVVRNVNVIADMTPPVITLVGYPSLSVELGTSYVDAGATGTDNIDGDISGSIVTTSTVDTNAVGSYSVTYNASDAAGNMATPVVRTVNVTADMTPPVITLAGYPSLSVELGTSYVDAGATGTDNIDGDISNNIVSTNSVDTNAVGSYSIIYKVSDAAGNAATPLVRTVHVIGDNPAERVDAKVEEPLDVAPSVSSLIETEVIRDENISGDWSGIMLRSKSTETEICAVKTQVESSGENSVEVMLTTHGKGISKEGESILYDFAVGGLMDSRIKVDSKKSHQVDKHLLADREKLVKQFKQGRKATLSWQGASEDQTATLSLTGFTRAYDTAKGWCDGDESPPVINLVGNSSEEIELGTAYVDAGANAFDDIDGDISGNIVSTSSVDTNAVGIYSIIYKVSDAAGNAATPLVRTVHVIGDNAAERVDAKVEEPLDVAPSVSSLIETEVIRDENISGDWSGIMLRSKSTETEICAVKTQVESSGENSVEVMLTTHGKGISKEGESIRYDFAVGGVMDSRIKVDSKKSHQVDKHLLADREKLVKQFKQGRKATLSWQGASEDQTATLSLTGFTRAYDTAKGWCD